MNWTGGKRNKIKVKLELQKQREFFDRQRLKKVHSFLNIEPRCTRTLPSIEVVRKNNSLSSDLSNCDHYKRHKVSENMDNIDLGSKNITKRKQSLLKDNDWAGVGATIKNIEKLHKLVDSRNHVHNPRASTPSTFITWPKQKYYDRYSISTKADSSTAQTDVNNANSQNTTLAQSVDVESLEWHQFLISNSTPTINDQKNCNFIESAVQDELSLTNQNDFGSSKVEYEWQNESSPLSKSIATTALHYVASESVTASDIERNKIIQAPDDNTTMTYDSKKNLSCLDAFNYKDTELSVSNITLANESSEAIREYSIDKKNLKEHLSTGPNMTIDQEEVLKRIHDLEVKNAKLQLEISYLRNDISKLLMKKMSS